MKFPTIMIQLRTDNGLPVDMPDDLQTAALDIGMQLQEAWLTGVDCVYGSVDRELFLKAEKEIDGDLIKDIEVPVELDDIESCRNEIAHLMLAIRDLTDENLVACREAICSIRDTVHIELSKIQAKHFSAIQNDGVEI